MRSVTWGRLACFAFVINACLGVVNLALGNVIVGVFNCGVALFMATVFFKYREANRGA